MKNPFSKPEITKISEEKHCFMTLRDCGGYKAFPIQDVLDGKRNEMMAKNIDSRFCPCKLYETIEEASQSLYAMTRPSPHETAFIVKLDGDIKRAKELILNKQLNFIIKEYIGYKVFLEKKYFNQDMQDVDTNPLYEDWQKKEFLERTKYKCIIRMNMNKNFNPELAKKDIVPVSEIPLTVPSAENQLATRSVNIKDSLANALHKLKVTEFNFASCFGRETSAKSATPAPAISPRN